MDLIKIGTFIKEQREKLGYSQNELSEKLYCTRQAISSWENGKTLPDSSTLIELSNLFHVSINTILCSDIEGVALSLIDDNKKKDSIIKRILLITTIIITSLLILMLSIYFINNYNSIKVYKSSAESKLVRIVDGIIISTPKNTYFKLGDLEYKKKDIKVNKLKLYYLLNNKKHIIFESDVHNRLFIDNNGYKELLRKDFKEIKDNIYLEINYSNNEKEILKINIQEKYSNDYILVIKEDIVKEELRVAYEQEENNYLEYLNIRKEDNNIVKYEPKEEVIENNIIEEEQEIEETEEVKIDYDEIINIIKEKGIKQGFTNMLEYDLNDININISEIRNSIYITVTNDLVIEEWIYNNKMNDIVYKSYENNEEINNKKIDINNILDEDIVIKNKMDEYLKLVYES